VSKKPVTNIAASVRQRLSNLAREKGRPFNEILQYFAMERFLYRLSESPHRDRFVLKGALLFTVWQAQATRPTMDIDLLGQISNSIDGIIGVFQAVCQQPVHADGLVFDPASVSAERIPEDARYDGVRVTVRGTLGTARISLHADIGFSDVVVPPPSEVDYPSLLGMPSPKICGYSRETVVAEKFEAMVSLDVLNSRMKDFYDLWFLARNFDFDGAILADALAKTFANRETVVSADPVALTAEFHGALEKQTQWRAFIGKNRLADVPHDLAEVTFAIAAFLRPVSAAVAAARAFEEVWRHPGPWRRPSRAE